VANNPNYSTTSSNANSISTSTINNYQTSNNLPSKASSLGHSLNLNNSGNNNKSSENFQHHLKYLSAKLNNKSSHLLGEVAAAITANTANAANADATLLAVNAVNTTSSSPPTCSVSLSVHKSASATKSSNNSSAFYPNQT
jgi:hypothetical protein